MSFSARDENKNILFCSDGIMRRGRYYKGASMWQRKTKSAAFIENFNDQYMLDEHDDFIHLNTIRLYAEAWDLGCRRPDAQEFDLGQFETMIHKSIEAFWGPCDCKFLRDDHRILVRSRDGKSMELVTGEQPVPPPIRSMREMVLH